MKTISKTKLSVCFYRSFGIILATLLIAANGYTQDNTKYQWSKSASRLTVFEPGDAVRVKVYELDLTQFGVRDLNLSNDYPINPEGYIIMPLIGSVKVKGYTVHEVMRALEDRLSEYLNNTYVYVRPLIRITLQGAFNKPGVYHVDPSSSVWDVVKLGGGPNGGAQLARMRVERGGKVVIPKVLEAFEKSISLEEVGIESGDQLLVPDGGGLSLTTLFTLFNLFASMVLVYLRLKSGSL